MKFGEVLEEMKLGAIAAREGWNGANMFVYIYDCMDDNFNPCFVLKTSSGSLQPGWVASTADLLAEDWRILEEGVALP